MNQQELMNKVAQQNEVKETTGVIKLKEIDAPILTEKQDGTGTYFVIKCKDEKNVKYRIISSIPINEALEKSLDKLELPYFALDHRKGTYKSPNGNFPYDYQQVELPTAFKNKYEKVSYQEWKEKQKKK